MTKSIPFLILLPLLLSLNSGGHVKFADGRKVANNNSSWCVAKPSSTVFELNTNIEYACNAIGDCSVIQSDGCCFNPNNLVNHASVVMNQYYATAGRNTWDCYFSGSGLIVTNDPSYGSCKYA
ncbi:major pollen allergen Ole e 10-like [Lotus japonicus]|uniref:major pollen allergen Ole e 10-like n=1 Tax=Lotus japonicus TaxID=34305 RepID=UPI0025868792|nr:major pollen allergen Ole e 10-like [Lotus japonicus]